MNSENSQKKFLNYLIILVLGLTASLYYGILDYQFLLNFDDDMLILNSPELRELNGSNLKIILTSFFEGLYHPLTSIFWMLELHFFGTDPGLFHLSSLILHLANTFLIFLLGKKIGKKTEIGLIAALFFGIQPMHVENVAWASSQKDLLVGFFFLLSLISYLRYRSRKTTVALMLTFAFVLLAMMSKASAIVLPFLFMLIDWLEGDRNWKQMLVSKTAFLILTIAFSIANYLAQKEYGYISKLNEDLSFFDQLSFVFYSAFYYLQKLIVPIELSPKNLYPEGTSSIPTFYYLSILFVILIAAITYQFRKSQSWLVFGILFYAITILPTLKIIPTGNDIVSNRYAYLAFIGLYIVIASYFSRLKLLPKLGIVLLIGAFWARETYAYHQTFKNGYSVWSAVIDAHEDRKWGLAMAYNERGQVLYKEGKYKIALEDVNRALQIESEMTRALLNRANLYDRGGKPEEALKDLNFVLSKEPDNIDAIKIRSTVYGKLNKTEEAIKDAERALELNSENPELYNNLGILYSIKQEYPLAIENFEKAIGLAPLYLQAHMNLGKLYIDLDRKEEALRELAIVYNRDPEVYYNAYLLGRTYFEMGEVEKAEIILRKFAAEEKQASQIANSLFIDSLYEQSIPYYTMAMGDKDIRSKSLYQRSQAYINIGEKQNALDDLLALIEVVPNPQFFYDIAILFEELGNREESCKFLYEAEKRDHPKAASLIAENCADYPPEE